jgi:hypothetical protein
MAEHFCHFDYLIITWVLMLCFLSRGVFLGFCSVTVVKRSERGILVEPSERLVQTFDAENI